MVDRSPGYIFIEAREWLLDCGADEDQVAEESDISIMREVERIYEGGWEQFKYDLEQD